MPSDLAPRVVIIPAVVMLTAEMTEPTPMMMPNMVRTERILLRRSARPAIRKVARILTKQE